MNELVGHTGQFRHPAASISPVRVKLLTLQDRVEDTKVGSSSCHYCLPRRQHPQAQIRRQPGCARQVYSVTSPSITVNWWIVAVYERGKTTLSLNFAGSEFYAGRQSRLDRDRLTAPLGRCGYLAGSRQNRICRRQ